MLKIIYCTEKFDNAHIHAKNSKLQLINSKVQYELQFCLNRYDNYFDYSLRRGH